MIFIQLILFLIFSPYSALLG